MLHQKRSELLTQKLWLFWALQQPNKLYEKSLETHATGVVFGEDLISITTFPLKMLYSINNDTKDRETIAFLGMLILKQCAVLINFNYAG